MSEGGASSREQRVHPRRLAELPVLVQELGERVRGAIQFDTRDVSLGGAFLRSDLLFEVGEELELEFQLPDGGRTIRTRGRVVHVQREPIDSAGMGIAFAGLDEGERAAVRAYLAQR